MAISPPVVITGGAGFIGSHLAEALLAQGRSVVVFDNLNDFYDPALKISNLTGIRQAAEKSGTRLRVLIGDICRTEDLLAAIRAAGEGEPPVMVHLAAMAGVRPSIQDPLHYEKVNISGTLCVLEACRLAGAKQLLFGSSSSVYGNNSKVPFAEEDSVDNPISPYAATKKAGELLCHTYYHLYGISVACLRFFTVYGPRQRPDLAIHKFARLMAAGKPLPFFGDGSTRRDYTFVDDILQGVLGALDWLKSSPRPVFDIFNLGESRTTNLAQLVRLLEKELGIPARLKKLPMQPGDVECTYADINKARRVLGYDPQVPIEGGIGRFVEWFRLKEGVKE